jgi:5-methylthioadenosine/S-adenosylhomocysteine deaminase
VKRTLVVGDAVIALAEQAVVEQGALIVEGSTIREVGPREVLEQRGPFDEVIGGAGSVVMPGFVNAHYHSECWTGQGLIGTIFELANLLLGSGVQEADEEVLELLCTYGLIQVIKGGQTSTVDAWYGKRDMPLFGAEAPLRAYEKVGVRTALALSLRDQNTLVHADDEAFLARVPPAIADEVRRSPLGYAWPIDEMFAAYDVLVDRWHGRADRISVILGPDWTPACSDELYVRCRQVADEYGTGITTHVLETRSELMWNLEVYGKPAVRRLADLGILGPDVTFSHFVWATDEDIAVFADSGAVASTNPGSNLRLSSGIARVRDIMAAGGRIAFGTDGISFSDREDYFAELRLATYLQRQPDVFDEHRLDSESVLRAMGTNGAEAVRAPGRVGSLAPGMLADLLVLDASTLLFPPGRFAPESLLDVLIDRGSAADIEVVMINGEVVLRDGEATRVDEAKVVDRLNELAERGALYHSTEESRRWAALAIEELYPRALPIYQRWYDMPIDAPAAVFNARRGPVLG